MVLTCGLGIVLVAVSNVIWASFLLRFFLRFEHRSCCGFSCGLGIIIFAIFAVVWASFLLRFLLRFGHRSCCGFCWGVIFVSGLILVG